LDHARDFRVVNMDDDDGLFLHLLHRAPDGLYRGRTINVLTDARSMSALSTSRDNPTS